MQHKGKLIRAIGMSIRNINKRELADGVGSLLNIWQKREACGYAVLPFRTVVGCVKASREDRDVVQDNLRIERPHVENNTVELLASLLDYYLFGKVKEPLRGIRCNKGKIYPCHSEVNTAYQ